MKIRKISSKDYPDYYKIRMKALSSSPEAFGMSIEEAPLVEPKIFPDKVNDPESAIFISYNDDDEPCGMLGIQREKGIKRQHVALIWGMFVDPNSRGKNIASQLLIEAIQFAKSGKIERLYLNVNAENKAACKLYSKFGFKHCGTETKTLKINNRYYDEFLFEMLL